MILLIDNYDSFVFNLSRYLVRLGQSTQVVRNDRITVAEVRRLRPQAVVISPGPASPQEAGVSLEIVRELADEVPILGVCLGHQVIAAALGGRVVRCEQPQHGRGSWIHHHGGGLFRGLANPFFAGRYHSLRVEESSLPGELRVTARTAEGLLMAIEHTRRPVVGWQFHPESILTDCGYELLAAFLERAGCIVAQPRPQTAAERRVAAQAALPAGPVTF